VTVNLSLYPFHTIFTYRVRIFPYEIFPSQLFPATDSAIELRNRPTLRAHASDPAGIIMRGDANVGCFNIHNYIIIYRWSNVNKKILL
tara:strand:- start:314 stop:577 length:264 start_codon:yes stop_codon:yes gene_type:complete